MIGDLDKEMQEGTMDEKLAQGEYEELMADSAEKRANDSKAVQEKSGAKANLEAELQSAQDSKAAEEKELLATKEYLANLHGECDWLLENFEARKTARADELDALGKAKAVLSGADYSALLQTGAFLARVRHT